MTRIDVELEFRYAGGAGIVCQWAEDLAPGSITAWLGASGSGKTTLLRCLAGLERPQRGRVVFDGRSWFDSARRIDVPPERREIGVLFQEYALFPHLTVLENVSFGQRGGGPRKVAELLETFRLTGLERRMPRELSGGQQQRVALARALCREPRLLLLDEPLSALDTPTREELRQELGVLIRGSGVPACIITHDRVDALTLADRTMLFDGGQIVQAGATRDVFADPRTSAAAKLVGVDTVVAGSVSSVSDGMAHVSVDGRDVYVAAPAVEARDVFLCIRAEDVALARHAGGDLSATNRWPAVVSGERPDGPFVRVTLECGFRLSALVTREAWARLGLAPGDQVHAIVKASAIQALPRT